MKFAPLIAVAGLLATGGVVAGAASAVAIHGIVDHQLVQRTTDTSATFEISGEIAGADSISVWLKILQTDGGTVKSAQRIAESNGGRWSGKVSMPVGGPYDLVVELRDASGSRATTRAADVLVGDIWVLAGQSNMVGRARLEGAEESSPFVRVFDSAGRWRVAAEPLHELKIATDPAFSRSSAASARATDGAGLGLRFAKEVAAATKLPIGLVPCAVGGTAIARWDPADASEPASLYSAMLRRVRGAGGKVKGVLWYQGEADARNPVSFPLYAGRQRALVAALRRDLQDPKLPFYYAQLSRILDWIYFEGSNTPRPPDHEGQWTRFREMQRTLEADIQPGGMVATIDLPLGDAIHLDTVALQRTGKRFATLGLHETYGFASAASGPRLSCVRLDVPGGKIELEFSGVTGSLRSEGRMAGFTLHKSDGSLIPALYRADVSAERGNVVVLSFHGQLPAGTAIAYGWGTNPYCNVVDAADMAVPAFGPLKL